jgi:hypothetical protein
MEEIALLIAIIAILLGVGLGLFSRAGSEIDVHPRSAERDETAGSGGATDGPDSGGLPSTHGTR